MKRLLAALALLAAVAPLATPGIALAQTVKDPNVTEVRTNDEAMNAAMRKARDTLSRFIEMSKEKVPSRYSIKMPLTTGGNTEHIWMVVTGYDGERFTGKLSNTPAFSETLQAGSTVDVAASEISDWMVQREDGIYGAYTLRVLLPRLPKEQADAYRARLRD